MHPNPKVLVIDIEGTTTPISFVSQTLFPYARAHLDDYLEKNGDQPEVKAWVEELFSRDLNQERTRAGAVKIAQHLIDNDVKFTPLKALQGKIWKAGYEEGTLVGALFDDVRTFFEKWSTTHRIFIYSSGSVEAQRLLFSHSAQGDLCPYISGYFDTKIGSKKEARSYQAIHESIGCDREDLHFLTDSEAEAKSAKEADWRVILMTRPGNGALVDEALIRIPRCCDFKAVDTLWEL